VRVLHLVSYSLYSGPMAPTLGLALAQRRLGHEVALAYDVKRGAFNAYEEAAAPHLEPHHLASPVSLTMSAKSSPLEWWRDLSRLRGLMGTGGPDVVHVHLSHDHGLAALARLGRGAPLLVRTIHAARSLAPRLGQRFVHRRTSGFVTRSAEHQRRLVDAFGVDPRRAAVIPGGIDMTPFAPAAAAARESARHRFGLPTAAFVIGHVALIAGRGQEELARALLLMPEASRPTVLYVGRGEGEPQLRRLVRELGLDPFVRFAGYLAGSELSAGYAALDAAFVAQPGNDASARAALEALAAGLPTAAVSTEALAELVTDERGYPIAERSPRAIARELARIISDPERSGRAARGRAYVESERSFAREAERTITFYGAL
jgi:glycosyltransferase involved in cell wall biosynthesis